MNKYQEISTSWSPDYPLRNGPTNCPRYFSCQNNRQSIEITLFINAIKEFTKNGDFESLMIHIQNSLPNV